MTQGPAAALALLRRAIDVVSGALLLAILLVVGIRVVARYLLNFPTPWSEELTRLLFIWMIMIAASRTEHLRIDLVTTSLGDAARRIARVLTASLGIALLLLLAWYGLDLIELVAYDRYTALGLSVQWLYRGLVLGTLLWALMIAVDLVADLVGGAGSRP